MRWQVSLFLLAVFVLHAPGCSSSSPVEPAAGTTPAGQPEPEAGAAVTICAAASTQDALEKLTKNFRASTGIEVRLTTGSSSGLANQILAGAPADLFLSASQKWSDTVAEAGLALEQTRLLTNRLVIVVPEENPGNVARPEDLLSENVTRVALAGEQAPAGMYANQALTRLNLLEPLTTAGKLARGQDVRVALSYVERGEAEAGIVYATDVRASSLRIVHEFDPALHDEIIYVLVRLKSSPENAAAERLYKYLVSADADKVYTEFGFQRPTKAK